jgi:hypothetical protein
MYAIEFHETTDGYCPVEAWLDDLTPAKQRAVYAALREVLEQEGPNVCGSFWGVPLGDGLFEFRIRHNEQQIRALTGQPKRGGAKSNPEKILLRIFCHAYGDKIVVLLGAYDKAAHDKAPYQ